MHRNLSCILQWRTLKKKLVNVINVARSKLLYLNRNKKFNLALAPKRQCSSRFTVWWHQKKTALNNGQRKTFFINDSTIVQLNGYVTNYMTKNIKTTKHLLYCTAKFNTPFLVKNKKNIKCHSSSLANVYILYTEVVYILWYASYSL